ncbi:MAG TPA: hypothetical protein VFV67_22200 [Actinophytocola sp.]|uniref:hypothetical protein n=1 Tax=Actinophytocola sp. TaxID=1872138 RepID=UPI002DBF7447|nr:hypothetical protein [Actinophytocola sp.]HEU5473364.1 hypothetical protein [Actinophytocola sp.]
MPDQVLKCARPQTGDCSKRYDRSVGNAGNISAVSIAADIALNQCLRDKRDDATRLTPRHLTNQPRPAHHRRIEMTELAGSPSGAGIPTRSSRLISNGPPRAWNSARALSLVPAFQCGQVVSFGLTGWPALDPPVWYGGPRLLCAYRVAVVIGAAVPTALAEVQLARVSDAQSVRFTVVAYTRTSNRVQLRAQQLGTAQTVSDALSRSH